MLIDWDLSQVSLVLTPLGGAVYIADYSCLWGHINPLPHSHSPVGGGRRHSPVLCWAGLPCPDLRKCSSAACRDRVRRCYDNRESRECRRRRYSPWARRVTTSSCGSGSPRGSTGSWNGKHWNAATRMMRCCTCVCTTPAVEVCVLMTQAPASNKTAVVVESTTQVPASNTMTAVVVESTTQVPASNTMTAVVVESHAANNTLPAVESSAGTGARRSESTRDSDAMWASSGASASRDPATQSCSAARWWSSRPPRRPLPSRGWGGQRCSAVRVSRSSSWTAGCTRRPDSPGWLRRRHVAANPRSPSTHCGTSSSVIACWLKADRVNLVLTYWY